MGIIKQGILGGFQNKVGPVIGSSWKGIATMRAMPISVANPRTAAQVTNRTKFSHASKMGSVLLAGIIKPLWDRFAQAESGFNAWLKQAVDAFNIDGTVDATKLVMSKGTVALPAQITVTWQGTGSSWAVDWNPALFGDALPTDQLYFVGLNTVTRGVFVAPAVAVRSAGSVSIQAETFVRGAGIVAFVMFRRADGSRVSNSFLDASA